MPPNAWTTFAMIFIGGFAFLWVFLYYTFFGIDFKTETSFTARWGLLASLFTYWASPYFFPKNTEAQLALLLSVVLLLRGLGELSAWRKWDAFKKTYPDALDARGSFVHEGILYEKPKPDWTCRDLAVWARFTLHYPDGSSKNHWARFFPKDGAMVPAAFKTMHREPWDNLEDDSSRTNIAEWKKYHGRQYEEANHRRVPKV